VCPWDIASVLLRSVYDACLYMRVPFLGGRLLSCFEVTRVFVDDLAVSISHQGVVLLPGVNLLPRLHLICFCCASFV